MKIKRGIEPRVLSTLEFYDRSGYVLITVHPDRTVTSRADGGETFFGKQTEEELREFMFKILEKGFWLR